MVDVWDDDERGPHKMPYNDNCKREKEEEYVPIWKILKEYYDEEKEKLYVTSSSPPRLGAFNATCYHEDEEYECEYEYEPSDEYSDYEEEEGEEEIPKETSQVEEIGDIIEKEIYKKFSYV